MNRKHSLVAKFSKLPAGNSQRELGDLVSVGPATVRALHSLGVHSVAQLAHCDAESLYNKLSRLRGRREDPCCLDVFAAAVAQARDSALPAEKCVWWYWSRQRKSQAAGRRRHRG
jgi:pathogenicity locus Cdd1 protein